MNELARANRVLLLLCGLSQRRGDFQWVTSGCAATPSRIPRTRIDGRDLFNFPKAGSVSRAPAPVVKPFP